MSANPKEWREARADARNLDRKQRTPREQIAILDARLGKGIGAARERARLAK